MHRILFKINSPYGKAKFGSFLFRCALRSFFPLTRFPSIPVAITEICISFFVFVKQHLACQGDCSRCYSMSKLPQLLYTFYSRCKPNPSATPLPCSLDIPFPFWDGTCCFPVFLLLPYNLQNGDSPFYLLLRPIHKFGLARVAKASMPTQKRGFYTLTSGEFEFLSQFLQSDSYILRYIVQTVYYIAPYIALLTFFLSVLC